MVGAFGDTVAASMANQVSELLPRYSRRRHLAAYRALRDAGIRLATDRRVGLALLHLPIPHAPPIYDMRRGAFSYDRPEGAGYFDNLALADRTFGDLRAAMEREGTWSSTAVIVFGDHGRRDLADEARIAHRQVPFLLRLPGGARGAAYAAPVNLACLRTLTMEILEGRVRTAEEAAAWLDANRHRWSTD
jgi:arylsulfatase A-like enzyme